MNEELALHPFRGVATRWNEQEDADVPTLDPVRDASAPWRRDRGSVTSGEVTAEAYERHAGEIHAFLLRTVRDPEAAADLVADAFTKLLIEERAGRTPLQPRPWLYRVAANLATSRGRRIQATVRRSLRLQADASREQVPSPEHAVIDRERNTNLWNALGRLTAVERAALLLAAQGYEGEAIAATIGRSHGATRVMMSRARRRLRLAMLEADA
jgi:RNA polymerase sigma factor (sigma-70 family)